jgi:hypothetical protein
MITAGWIELIEDPGYDMKETATGVTVAKGYRVKLTEAGCASLALTRPQ